MLHGVIQDDAIVVVDDLGLVPELDRPRPSAVGRNATAVVSLPVVALSPRAGQAGYLWQSITRGLRVTPICCYHPPCGGGVQKMLSRKLGRVCPAPSRKDAARGAHNVGANAV